MLKKYLVKKRNCPHVKLDGSVKSHKAIDIWLFLSNNLNNIEFCILQDDNTSLGLTVLINYQAMSAKSK